MARKILVFYVKRIKILSWLLMIGLLVANLMACQRVKVEEPFEANIKSSQESPYGSLAAYDGDGSIYYYLNP